MQEYALNASGMSSDDSGSAVFFSVSNLPHKLFEIQSCQHLSTYLNHVVFYCIFRPFSYFQWV